MNSLLSIQKSIIPSCDVSNLEDLKDLISGTKKINNIGAYKIGFELVLTYGLPKVVNAIKDITKLPIIYDHQKAGNDVPKMGKRFANVCKKSGVSAVILFPFAGPISEEVWIKECQDVELPVIVGGCMSHYGFSESDGGFISEASLERIYKIAIDCGIKDFVVPYNKPNLTMSYIKMFKDAGIRFTLYSPGFVDDTEMIKKFKEMAGNNWHLIIGSAIYRFANIQDTTRYLIERTIKPSCKGKTEITELLCDRVRCTNCGRKMELIGVTEKQLWNYYCNKCNMFIETKDR